jgi:hypothetical protein
MISMNKILRLFGATAFLVLLTAHPNGQIGGRFDFVDRLDRQFKQTKVKKTIEGNWGGEHISLVVAKSGATIELDCARAVAERPLIVDSRGNFSLTASYTPESFGPARQNNPAQSFRVKITGRISNQQMTLTIKRQSTNKPLGTFKLRRNREAFLVKCR